MISTWLLEHVRSHFVMNIVVGLGSNDLVSTQPVPAISFSTASTAALVTKTLLQDEQAQRSYLLGKLFVAVQTMSAPYIYITLMQIYRYMLASNDIDPRPNGWKRMIHAHRGQGMLQQHYACGHRTFDGVKS